MRANPADQLPPFNHTVHDRNCPCQPRKKSPRTKWLEKQAAKRGMTLAEMRRDQRSTEMSQRHSNAGHSYDGAE
jgi:hypothetical protein